MPPNIYTWKEYKSQYILEYSLGDGTTVHSEWLLRPLDDINQVRDLLSLELTGAWINEGREIKWEIFSALRGRIGRYPPRRIGGPTYPFIIIDSNPPNTEHWIYRFFEEETKNNPDVAELAKAFYQPSGLSEFAENLPNLPKNYYQELMVGQDEDWVRVHVHGEYGFLRVGKPVFSAYSDEVHCAKEKILAKRGLPIVIGMDFGLDVAACLTQQTPEGKLYVLDEILNEEPIDLETFVVEKLEPFLFSFYPGFEYIIIGDPAGRTRSQLDKRTCFSILKARGFKAFPAWTNSIQDRLRAVNAFLTRYVQGNPAFILSPACEVLRKALISGYHFRRIRVAGNRYSELPEKNKFSHIADALQYACLGYRPNSYSLDRVATKRSLLTDRKYSFNQFT